MPSTVDLPQPLGPSRVTNSSARTVRLTDSTACTAPLAVSYRLPIPSSTIGTAAAVVAPPGMRALCYSALEKEGLIMSDVVHLGSGKVRELYALDDERLLLVASDRISTFDVVLPTEIPDKGRVLTGLSAFWFARTRGICANHLLALRPDGRSTECRRLEMLPIECVVRGYLSGSGWKDYGKTGEVCGHRLPTGLRESDRLPEPIFTPATKATSGHDENITGAQAAALVGAERFAEAERLSIALYRFAAGYALERGIIIADTKFEFGVNRDGQLVLGDEALTPDSSRFWPAEQYAPGRTAALVRQAVRARLLREDRLGQDLPGPRAAARRGEPAPAGATWKPSSSSPPFRSTRTSRTPRSS